MLEQFVTTMRVAGAYWQARRRRFASPSAMEHWQDRQVQSHLGYVMARSGYYRELYEGRSLSDWRSFPLTDKQAMMANFDRYNTIGVGREEALATARESEQTRDYRPTLRGATVGLSSGTSGSYSLFLSSSRENAMFIGTALARLLRGSLLAEHRIAFFHRAHSNLYRGLDSGRLKHVFFDLRDDLESRFDALAKLSPTQIIGPPFVLRQLGKAVRAGRLSIAPRSLLSVAEVLDDMDRQQIEADFGLPVDQAYIATEGFIAATCSHGSLHVNEDCIVMQREWLDRDSGRFTPVITDFRRRVQPIIRYRLDDVLVDGRSGCDCGSTFAVLERVEGRCDDVLIAQSLDDQQLRRVFPDFVRRALCIATEDIRDYCVTQDAVDHLLVSLDVDEERRVDSERHVLESLAKMFDQLSCERPQIAFTDCVVSGASAKVRRVVRTFSTDLT